MNKQIVVIRCKGLLRSEELDSLEEKLRKEYETGFMFVPCYCEVFIADEVDATIGRTIRGLVKVDENGDLKTELLRPQGEWITAYSEKKKKVNKCRVCGFISIQGKTNYCPNCGAEMKGGAECSQTEK